MQALICPLMGQGPKSGEVRPARPAHHRSGDATLNQFTPAFCAPQAPIRGGNEERNPPAARSGPWGHSRLSAP